jgi:hypothetical protein
VVVGANEWLWRPVRRALTHNHQRREMAALQADLVAEFRDLAAPRRSC